MLSSFSSEGFTVIINTYFFSHYVELNCQRKKYSSLWKRVVGCPGLGRRRAASAYGIIWGMQVKTNMAEFRAECHSVDCSGGSKVLTELQTLKRIEKNSTFSRYLYDVVNKYT